MANKFSPVGRTLGCRLFISFPRAAWECSNGVPRRTSPTQCQNKTPHPHPNEFMLSVPHLLHNAAR
ncbi:MAG: hypothetical protein Q8Q54_01835 [Methylococcales bacterium]|nr:hypothetical protein [Methylococcales bacterium]